jgi:hypothetical protein
MRSPHISGRRTLKKAAFSQPDALSTSPAKLCARFVQATPYIIGGQVSHFINKPPALNSTTRPEFDHAP